MPRPKRTKISRPTAPVPAPRVIPLTEPVETEQVPTIAPATRPFDDLYDVSDEELNRSASAKRLNKGKALPTRSSGRNASRNLTESKKAKDSAKPEDAQELNSSDDDMQMSSSPEIESGRRGRPTSAKDNSVLAIGNFRRRAREPSILGRQTGQARSSSVNSDLAEENGLTSVGKRNTSGLGLGAFRGRAGSRRPSSVAGDRPEIGSVLRLGNFKRRAREPSILGTARKPQEPRPTFDLDSDSDDFAPEDESTPLNFTKARAQPSSSSSRKRKLSSVQVPRSQEATQAHITPSKLPVDDNDSELEDTVPATAPIESDEENGDLPELEKELSPEDLPLPSIERVITPEPMSETMAPPLGSSSLSPAQSLPSPPPPPQPVSNTRQGITRSRRIINPRTPPRYANTELQSSPISSPPSLTHSPDIPTYSTSNQPALKAALQPATLSTAALQALLPKRRQRDRSALEVESSDSEVDVTGLGEHDDELTITVAPNTRRQASVGPNSRASVQSAKRALKSKPTAKGKGRKTYGKKPATTASDKENEVDPDDSLAPIQDEAAPEEPRRGKGLELGKKVGKELKMAAKKFQEVDKWELDFEECEASSDQLAR